MKKVIILIVLLLGIASIIYINRTEDISKSFNGQIHRDDVITHSFEKNDGLVKIDGSVKHVLSNKVYKGTIIIKDKNYILNHLHDKVYLLSHVVNGRTKTYGTLEFNQDYTFIDIFEN